MKKINISIFTTRWGHISIAKAVRSALKKNSHKIYLNQIKTDKISGYSYDIAYQLFPSFTELPFKISEKEVLLKILDKYMYGRYKDTIKKYFHEQKPDVVINNYFAFNSIIENLAKRYKFLFINIVADPRTFHKLTVSKSGYNFVFDEKAKKNCLKFAIDENKCISSGWFVRKNFLNPYSKNATRKNLGIDNNILNLCVIGGSEGTYAILKIIPAFIELKKPIQLVFICGNNKNLLNSVKILSKIFEYGGSGIKIIPVGYTKEIYKYIQASDLVIGKAGPNLLFETVAILKPFFAISHIAGQEDGNLEIIKKYKLGFVEENPVRAIKLIRKIIENPKILKQFERHLMKMADYNNQAYLILQKFIEEKLKTT